MGMVRRGCGPGPAGRPGERGQAMVVVLTLVLLLGVALAVVAALLVSRMERVQAESRRVAVSALSDAAMAETLAHLAALPTYGGVPERPFGGGTIRSTVEHGAGKTFVIRSVARFQGAAVEVEARGRIGGRGPEVESWRRLPPGASGDDSGSAFDPPG